MSSKIGGRPSGSAACKTSDIVVLLGNIMGAINGLRVAQRFSPTLINEDMFITMIKDTLKTHDRNRRDLLNDLLVAKSNDRLRIAKERKIDLKKTSDNLVFTNYQQRIDNKLKDLPANEFDHMIDFFKYQIIRMEFLRDSKSPDNDSEDLILLALESLVQESNSKLMRLPGDSQEINANVVNEVVEDEDA
jgi:hypothetical protein